MSRENVELVETALEALNRRDWDTLLAFLDPDVEWEPTGVFLEAATYRGHEGARQYLGSMHQQFDDLRNDLTNIVEAGDLVIADLHAHGIGTQSRVPVEVRFTAVVSIANGKIQRVRHYFDRAEALMAAGLTTG